MFNFLFIFFSTFFYANFLASISPRTFHVRGTPPTCKALNFYVSPYQQFHHSFEQLIKKKYNYKTVKDVQIDFIGLKKTCLGVLERGKRDKDNETGMKEEGGIQMSTKVLPLRDARSPSLKITYLVNVSNPIYEIPYKLWLQLYVDEPSMDLDHSNALNQFV